MPPAETNYDTGGRTIHRRVTTVASGFDGAVRRISTTYDSHGRMSAVTQWDNAAAGSGNVVDEVTYAFDNWGNLTGFEQDRNSAVHASGSVDSYLWANTYSAAGGTASGDGRLTLRRTQGRIAHVANAGLPPAPTPAFRATINYGYGAGHDDDFSRVSTVSLSSTVVAGYSYNGSGHLVGTDYPEIEVMSNRFLTTSGSYPDLDRFNRVTTSRWTRDLATDRHFYEVDLAYDRNGGIDWLQDVVWPGRDVLYSNDSLGRLQSALEGTVSAGSLITATRTEAWTLSQTGNWHERTLDLDGDGFFTGSGELFDCGTFNKANEWTKRDTDCDTTDDVTMVYDAVGNLIDDGVSYTFEYDPFGRMRTVRNRTTTDLVAEYRYNGLGYRIGWHYDVNVDGDVDGSDPWFYFVYDDAWRQVATFRENDTNAKEVFVHHMAGANGRGGSSALDAVIMRDKDANTAWGTAMDGTREERMYYCQNWRGDVVNLLKVTGSGTVQVAETVRYSSYGVPFSIPPGDVNGDGVVDLNDTWPGSYTVRCDYDLDGDVDFDDENIHVFATATLGRGILSDLPIGNRRGYCGYEHDGGIDTMCHVRNRVLLTELGRWTRRDPLGYVDGMGLYGYVGSRPHTSIDYSGLWEDPLLPGGGSPTRPRAPNGNPFDFVVPVDVGGDRDCRSVCRLGCIDKPCLRQSTPISFPFALYCSGGIMVDSGMPFRIFVLFATST